MMKKDYRKPELLVSLFDTKDVITASVQAMNTSDSASIGGAAGGGSLTDEIDFNGSGLE